ncbi:Golgi reassembly-stacking 2-like [Brachionus plicatilis]|uniref:Golgi reassembly-stacking 2-like n=1 Tax=Brachionus plicatilis TaxID=10195 RepID=A0A3M7SKW8_BRAPC|nr:Golgi reassembly-stacking 2-like [Brachionus plicatilis]
MGIGGSSVLNIPGGGSEGYHVLKVQENSPGARASLEPFFDFIIAINGSRLDQDNDTLRMILNSNIDKPCKLLVFSSKTMNIREITLVPTKNWGGQGVLGVSIRFCSFERANENVWHVLEVQPNSPASLAGLRSNTDYIIGSDSLLTEPEDLFTLIESSENKQLKLYVYNFELDNVREVLLTPNSAWGGEGSLGCGIGYGYLHRIPIKDEKKSSLLPNMQSSNSLNPNVSMASNLSTMTNIGSQSSLLSNISVQSSLVNSGNITLNPNVTAESSPSTEAEQLEKQLEKTHLAEPENHSTQVPNENVVESPSSNPTFASTFGTVNMNSEVNLPAPININQYFPNMSPQAEQTALPNKNPTVANTNLTNQENVQVQPPINFLQHFKLPEQKENVPNLPPFNPELLSGNSNQIVQNLVQQTISNHFQQQMQQHNFNQTGASTPTNVQHGHSHEGGCSGHGHSH